MVQYGSAALLKGLHAMLDQQILDRIAVDPVVMRGKPVIKGTRLTVEYILNLLGHGVTMDELRQDTAGLREQTSMPVYCSRRGR